MAWIAPITGHCDNTGRIRCIPCHKAQGLASDMEIVADNSAFHGFNCDVCAKPFPVTRNVNWQTVWVDQHH